MEAAEEPFAVEPPPAEAEIGKAPPPDTASLTWPPNRIAVIEKLWGEGYTTPGGTAYIQEFLPLLGLSEKKSLLLLGAGLGGIGRTLSKETNVWVTGLEGDEELAALGMEQSVKAGMSRKVPVKPADFENLVLKPKSFDFVLSFGSLYPVKDKEKMFTEITASLRVDGEFLFTDFVLSGNTPPDQAVIDWVSSHKNRPHPWTTEKITAFLSTLPLDVRPPEDVTRSYRKQIFKGLFDYLSGTTRAELTKIADDVISECEYWGKRVAALDSGNLKVYKFHAIKLPEKSKGGW